MIDGCRANGLDPVAFLDKAGLLRYGASTDLDRLEILDWLIQALDTTPADRLPFNRMPSNPIDLKNVFKEFLTDVREGLARKGTEGE